MRINEVTYEKLKTTLKVNGNLKGWFTLATEAEAETELGRKNPYVQKRHKRMTDGSRCGRNGSFLFLPSFVLLVLSLRRKFRSSSKNNP